MKKNQILSWVVLGIFLVTLGFLTNPSKVQAAAPGSVIGTSTTTAADAASFQRKSFYAQNKFWVFFVSPPNIVYKTSPDGITWGAQQTMRSGGATSGDQFSVWSDGTSVYYAFTTGATAAPIYFRKGTLNGGGTITWANGEVIAVPGVSGVSYTAPSIVLDSNGYAWIGYRRTQGTAKSPFITKNKNNNGTWAAAPGFPYDLAGWTAAGWVVAPVPLDSGKMVAIYVSPGHFVRARSWSGTAWVGGFTSTKAVTNNLFSAVGRGDDVHIAFLETSVIRYIKYNSTSNTVTPEETIQSGLPSSSAPVMSIDNGGDLHLFWAGSPASNHIFYKQNAGGIWDASALDIVDEGTEKINSNSALTTPYFTDLSQGEIVFYLTKLASPYNVKSSRGNTSISLKKTGPAIAYLGDTISYQFEVKNNGKVSLSNVSVTDPLLGGVISPSIPSLAAGASVPFSKNYTVPNSAPAVLVNRAYATGTNGLYQVNDSDSSSTKIINPVSVKKTGPIYAFDGDQVTFTITIRNDWNQPLEITKVDDTLVSPPIFQGSHFLNPGNTWSHTITTTPAWQNTPFVNTVTVWAKKGSHEVTASDTFKLYPLTIKKDVVGEQDNTEFEVWIKDYRKLPYPGTQPFKISENKPKKIWLSECTHWFKEVILYPNCYRLVPDGSYVIKYYPQYNSEFAEFKYEAGKENWNQITFKNKNYCKICIDKSGPEQSCYGDKITYNYKVWNCSEIPSTGDQPILNNVKVTDDKLLFTENIGTLNPGESKEFTKDHTLPMVPGPYTNTATATGKHDIAHDGGFPTTSKTVSATDNHTVNVEDCRKAQICGFKWDDDNGDGKWTICHHLIFFDQFDDGDLDGWVPQRGTWVEEGGFLKQTDSAAGNPNDPLILYGFGDESKKYHALSFRAMAKPVAGTRDFGLVFFAQDDTHYYLFRVDGAAGKIGVFRRNGPNYEVIIDKTFAEVGIGFAVENGKFYGMKVNTYDHFNTVAFYFDELGKFDKPGELNVFSLPFRETFGCPSGYVGLRTHTSSVDFDWAFQSAEVGLEGWEIKLEGPVNATAITGPDGSYCFTNLPAGSYKVYEVLQPGWEQTYPAAPGYYEIALNPGDNVGCVNFGNHAVCLPPPANMISWWPGDENTQDYADSNNGTLVGGATYGDGKVGKAFTLNGTSAYVHIGNPANLEIAGDVTIDAWIKIQGLQEGQVVSIAGKWGYNVNLDSYVLSAVKVNGQIMLAAGIGDCSTPDQGLLGRVIKPNEWTHVAMTYKKSSGENIIYINGVNVGSRTRTGGICPTQVNFLIGAQEQYGTTPWRFFPGLIDEVEIFNRALGAEEIEALHDVGSRGKCKPRIDIEKYVAVGEQASWDDADSPTGPEAKEGGNVYFWFRVTNIGNVTLTDITLSDTDFNTQIGAQCTIPGSLDPGQYFDCTIGPITAVLEQHKNTATATGKYKGVTVSDSDDAHYLGIQQTGGSFLPGDFRTQTQGGWGNNCAGNNPGCYRDNNFAGCFDNGLMVGGGICPEAKTLTFTSSAAIKSFLPQGGTAAALTSSYTDPPDLNNILAGQVVALALNIGFDYCDANFGASSTALKQLIVNDPASPCYNWTVEGVFLEANVILGGCTPGSGLTASQVNECVSKINENFVDGTTVGTFLRLP